MILLISSLLNVTFRLHISQTNRCLHLYFTLTVLVLFNNRLMAGLNSWQHLLRILTFLARSRTLFRLSLLIITIALLYGN